MRIDGLLSWDAVEDRTRTVTDAGGYADVDQFEEIEKRNFLQGYYRNLTPTQKKYIEVWVEKEALFPMVANVADRYCVSAVVCRGYQSVTFLKKYMDRAEEAIERGQRPVILYFGDLDPSGIQMFEASKYTLCSELNAPCQRKTGIYFNRIALFPEQIPYYNLPQNPGAAKISDSRYPKYVEQYGDIAVELDALHPEQLTSMISEAIELELNMDLYNEERRLEEEDTEHLEEMRGMILEEIEHMSDLSDI
jgi:hypothetical protein